jgi:hypothetical protein
MQQHPCDRRHRDELRLRVGLRFEHRLRVGIGIRLWLGRRIELRFELRRIELRFELGRG